MVEYIKYVLTKHGSYCRLDVSSNKMEILSGFLKGDVQYNITPFINWALDESSGKFYGGNITDLEKDGTSIILTDSYSDEEVSVKLRINTSQFVQMLQDWDEKVCKKKPKNVLIKYENNEYTIETSDE